MMKRTEQDPGVSRWKKTGGGSFHAKIAGKIRIIKPGEVFLAREDEIPEGFRDVVKPLDTVVQSAPKEPVKAEVPEKEAPKPETSLEYSLQPRKSGGYYDVVDKDGKPQNEKALRKDAADALLESLME